MATALSAPAWSFACADSRFSIAASPFELYISLAFRLEAVGEGPGPAAAPKRLTARSNGECGALREHGLEQLVDGRVVVGEHDAGTVRDEAVNLPRGYHR